MNYTIAITICSLLLILAFVFVACNNLPNQPKNISVSLYQGGGMTPEYTRININADSCLYETNQRNGNQGYQKETITYKVSREALDALYVVFKKYNFQHIQIRKEKDVHDRGGTSITLTIDGKTYNKSNSGLSFVKKNSAGNYQAIMQAIFDLNTAKIKENR